jgi:hypothetical protein
LKGGEEVKRDGSRGWDGLNFHMVLNNAKGEHTSIGIIIIVVLWANLLRLKGLILDLDELDHFAGI